MRRLGFLFGLVLVALTAVVARASFIATCKTNRDWVTVNAPYRSHGQCAMPTVYTPPGVALVDPNSANATQILQAAGKGFCGSVARFPKVVLFEPDQNAAFVYTFVTGGRIHAGNLATNVQATSGADLSASTAIKFSAICE